MNPETADLLSQLRDIHGAPPAPFWPPAPGWWVLAALLLLALYFAWRRFRAGWLERQRRQRLLEFLEMLPEVVDPDAQPQAFLASVNQLLKLVALRAFPGEHCAALKGQDWVKFLAATLESGGEHFEVLASGVYQPSPAYDAAAVQGAARAWIERHG